MVQWVQLRNFERLYDEKYDSKLNYEQEENIYSRYCGKFHSFPCKFTFRSENTC